MNSLPVGLVVEVSEDRAIVVGLPFWVDYRPVSHPVEVTAYSEGSEETAHGRLEASAGRLASVAVFDGAVKVGMKVRYRSRPPSIPLERLDSEFSKSFGAPHGFLCDGQILPDVGTVGLGPWYRKGGGLRNTRAQDPDTGEKLGAVAIHEYSGEGLPPDCFTYLEGDTRQSPYGLGAHPPILPVGTQLVAINSVGDELGSRAADEARWDEQLRRSTTFRTPLVSVIAKRAVRAAVRPFTKEGPRLRGRVVICAAHVYVEGLSNPQLGEGIVVCDTKDEPLALGYVAWLPEHPQYIKDEQIKNNARHLHRLYCGVVINQGLAALRTGYELRGEDYRFYKLAY